MTQRNKLIIIGALVVFGILALCCVAVIIAGSIFTISNSQTQVESSEPTPVVIRPTTVSVLPPSQDTQEPNTPLDPVIIQSGTTVPTDTLKTLVETIVPVNNLTDLALRLEGKQNIPETMASPAAFSQVGKQSSFWVTNIDNNSNFEIDATLEYVSEHVYFWIEDGIQFNQNDLRRLVDTFEEEIYPTNREFFGSEWTPGVDGDPHLYILYAKNMGFSIAGYYFLSR